MMISRLSLSSLLLAFAGTTMAQWQDDEDRYYEKGETLHRSPCPPINVLANHGYLPRDGKNISSDEMLKQFEDVFGIPRAGSVLAWNSAVRRGLPTWDVNGTAHFDLFDLYDCCDHDASMVRQDPYFETLPQYDPELYEEMEGEATNDTYITPEEMSQHQYNRIIHSRLNNPEFEAIDRFPIILTGDLLVFTFVIIDPATGEIPLSWLESFLGPQALPEDYIPFMDRGIEMTSIADPQVQYLNQFYFSTISAALAADLSNYTVGYNITNGTDSIFVEVSAEDIGLDGQPPIDEGEEGDTAVEKSGTDEETKDASVPADDGAEETVEESAAATQTSLSLLMAVGALFALTTTMMY